MKPGDRIERYEVLQRLGVGGMATVWQVRHVTLGTLHALKVLDITGRALEQRLVEEGRAQAHLRHPNIVPVTDVLRVDGSLGLLMDFVDGPDLDAWIPAKRPGPQEAEAVFRGVLAGVQAAHASGRIHRDLKPANVLMARDPTGDWVPRVSDFGLVKAVQGDDVAWKTRSGIAMGTPRYMAPEQFRDAGAVDHRADVFSLGCLLYELLAHRIMWEGDDMIGILERIEQREHPPLPIGVPERLAEVVAACTEPSADDRPADCGALLALLDREATTERTPASRASGTRDGATGAPGGLGAGRRHLAAVAGAGALVVGLIALGAVVFGTVVLARVLRSDPGAPCRTYGGALGVAKAPLIFTRRAGGTWSVRTDTPVLDAPPTADHEGRAVCTLPAGSRLVLVDDPSDGWVTVHGRNLTLPDPVESEPEGPLAAEVEVCSGPSGRVIGWFYTRPLLFGGQPRQGGEWALSSPKDVVADPGSDRVVCRLSAGMRVRVDEAPQRADGGWWVPVTGDALR